MQTILFMKNWQRLFSTVKCTFTKEENNEKFKDRNFAIVCWQFIEYTFAFTKKSNDWFWYMKKVFECNSCWPVFQKPRIKMINKEPSYLFKKSVWKFKTNSQELKAFTNLQNDLFTKVTTIT